MEAGSDLRPSRVNRNVNQASLSYGKAALFHEEGVNSFYLDNPGGLTDHDRSKVTSKEVTTGDEEKSRQRDEKSKKRKTRTDDDRASNERQKQTCGLCNDSAYGLMVCAVL